MAHREYHRSDRIGWLRAAVLGANDGLISTGSLVIGLVSADLSHGNAVIAAVAALVAGALSMAAGEYVSVSSQADTERADLAREKTEIANAPEHEHAELAGIYVGRGLTPALAQEVATQMMAHDALGAHARDELGLYEGGRARPLQAAISSALAFSLGALPPVALAAVLPPAAITIAVAASSLVLLAVLGATAARLGAAPPVAGALRVSFWGALAMGATALVGNLFGAVA